MSLNPDEEREAKLLIEKVRAQHSLEGHDELAIQVQDLLHLVASELYDVSTHFLFELLQNADDNDYRTATPTLTFTYEVGGLRVDCNETGFRAKHVESISKVRRSTKSGQKHLNDYTGEKGIGFKSVFRVADQVWISSRQYRFKFDKNERFGMIAPRWADFPGPTSPEETSFYLKLSKGYNEEELVTELRGLDPTLLVFLKRLQKLTLRVLKDSEPPWEESIHKTTTCESGNRYTTINTNNGQLRFLTIDYRVENLPIEPKRPSSTHSEIILAFPLTDLEEPQPARYNVHAVLPIGDYGLKFMMNADFLLTANRLHIDISLPWNQVLRDGLAHAFIRAVNHFNKGKMRYHWPYFIPTSDISPFLQPSRHLILQNLRDNEFVESAAGALHRPAKEVHRKPSEWHTQLAKALLFMVDDPPSKRRLLPLPIVPLRGCGWTTVGQKPVLFSRSLNPANFPVSTTFQIVDPEAAADTHRCKLLERLGIQEVDTPQMCYYIAEIHASQSFDPYKLSKEELVSHVEFLYEASWCPSDHVEVDLWFATSDNKRCRGSELYIQDFSKGSLPFNALEKFRQMFSTIGATQNARSRLQVVHQDYLSQPHPQGKEDVEAYLIKRLHLSKIPRLVSFPHHYSKCDFKISEEFKFLLQECPITDIVNLLCSHWNTYSYWIHQNPFLMQSRNANARERLLIDIRHSIVQTLNGPSPLSETAIPMLDAKVSELGIPIPTLDISNPNDRTVRQILAIFGVKVVNDLDFYMACLKSIREHHKPPQHETISYIYEQINARYYGHVEEIYEEFESNELVYNPISESWLSASECADEKIDLKCIYPKCKDLFIDVAGCCLVQSGDPIEEAKSINMSSDLSNILDVLVNIGNILEEYTGFLDSMMEKLHGHIRNLKIFPIKKKLDNDGFDELLSCNDTWFIADRPHLAKSFDGTIPLLAFHAQDVRAFETLLKNLGLDSRKLSKCVEKTSEPSGNLVISGRDTDFFRSRSPALKALITRSNPRRAEICRQLDSVSVVWVTSIYQSCTLHYEYEPYRIGNQVLVEYALQSRREPHELTIFTTNTQNIYQAASFELAELLATYCDIHDPTARSLLHTTISELASDRVQSRFEAEGYRIHLPDIPTRKRGTKPRSGDQFMIPSTFSNIDFDDDFGDDLDHDLGFHIGRDAKVTNPDRRVPPMDIRNVHTKLPEDPINPLGVFLEGAHMDPGRHLEYLGQCMTSHFLKGRIGGTYNPIDHWTNDLRNRAGLPTFVERDVSPFTIKDEAASQDMTKFLVSIGHQHLQWNNSPPTYHLEIAVSSGDMDSAFVWSSSQLRRMQKFQNARTRSGFLPLGNSEDIMILVRVINIYTDPQIHFLVDPGILLTSRSLIFQDGLKFEAAIPDLKTDFFAPGLKMQPFFEMTYTYKSLKDGELRLFILFPGKKYDHLKGAIFMCPSIEVAKTAPYRTLSYEWGSNQQLHMPLFTHEGENSPVILWVDAICINQEDANEKAQQILLLPRIFQNAACTLAFLSAEGHFDEAIKTLLQIRAWNLYGTLPEKWPESLLPIPVSWAPHSNDVIWEGIRRFFAQTWFRRIWIVQEVTLAPTVRVICGSWMVDWNEIYEAVVALQRGQREALFPVAVFNSWEPFMTLSHMRRYEVRRYRWNMLKLLNMFSHADSTLKRDRFFSLLGLASDGNLEAFQPDYRTDITFESIACRFGHAFVAQGYGIQLLYRAGLSSQPNRFPSWLPDLTVPRNSSLLRYCEQGATYRASADKREDMYCFPPRLLVVKGYFVDQIDQISTSTNNRGMEARFEYFQEIDGMISEMGITYWSIDRDALEWLVPIAGAKYPKATFSGRIDLAKSYKAFRRQLAREKSGQDKGYHQQDGLPDSDRDVVWDKESVGYASLLDDNLLGWKFVVTKRNLFGVVPGNARVGDLVSIISGGDVPFLLRKPESQMDSLRYKLIGGCYIHGMMLGEALSFEDVKETMIHID
ncbi:hypothetical protein F5B19DRAFT_490478 [Rostrohypoxylon terebratum]|nr:hypothetical protein F5B19DRAFT_490478 [Rostrohypoxylon terebratum]